MMRSIVYMESPILEPMPQVPQTLDQVARERIKTWITSTGITQTALAEHVGRKQAWMSRYLSAEFDADLETLQKIARVFGHSLNALLGTPTDPDESRVIDLFRALPPSARPVLIDLLESWTRLRRSDGRTRK